jgi:hypothetical protein
MGKSLNYTTLTIMSLDDVDEFSFRNAEERGHKEGEAVGLRQGYVEAFKLGFDSGEGLGREIGVCLSLVFTTKMQLQNEATRSNFSSSNISRMEDICRDINSLIERIPSTNVVSNDVDIEDAFLKLRSRKKLLSSILYNHDVKTPNSSDQQSLSF